MSERRVALIQNAGSYCGPLLAKRLARAGHDLVVQRPRDGLVEELKALGAAVEVISETDVPRYGPGSDATLEGYQHIVDRTLARFGHLDAAALVPSNGSTGANSKGPLLQTPVGDAEAMVGYMVTTTYALRKVIPVMQGRGGQILVFTSDAGARPEAGWSLYGSARAGQNFLVQAVALEHAHEGICINALGSKNAVFEGFPNCPPGAATDDKIQLGEWSAKLVAETPLGRLGTMEELAAFAAVLLDGTNRFQTAHFFSFSGGWHAK
jgi:3-oxoacyl-[acyl-carrier protein] reductase